MEDPSKNPGLGRTIEREFEAICRAMLHGPETTHAPGYLRFVTGEAHPLGNFAIVSDPHDGDQTEEAAAPLSEMETPSAVLLSGDAGDEPVRVLTDRGYELAEAMPAMAVDLDRLAHVDIPEEVTVEQIDTGADDEWCAALEVGYGLPRRVADVFGPVSNQRSGAEGEALYYGLRKGGRIVSTSMIWIHSGMAGVYCVSTLPEERGSGLGAMATAAPLHLARERGITLGILHASAMGEPVYRRLGFESFGVVPLYVRVPG